MRRPALAPSVASCAFCGAPLAAGATFCRACGTAAGPIVAASAPAPTAARRPVPGAAIAIASLPAIALLFVLWMMFVPRGPFGPMGWSLAFMLVPTLIGAVALPLAWAIWRGKRAAVLLGLLGSVAWGGFTTWAGIGSLRVLMQGVDFVGSGILASTLFAFSQAIACWIALALLVRSGAWKRA